MKVVARFVLASYVGRRLGLINQATIKMWRRAQNDRWRLLIHFHPKIIPGPERLHWANFLNSGGSYGQQN